MQSILEYLKNREKQNYIQIDSISNGDKVRVKSKEEVISMCHKNRLGFLTYHFRDKDGYKMCINVFNSTLMKCGKVYKVRDLDPEDGTLMLGTDIFHIDLLEEIV